jgi:GNAT superfamily N-acetyltransferase
MIFADLALARRLEAAEAQKYLDYAATRGSRRPEMTPAWEPIAGGYAVYAGDGNPYSRAIGLGLYGPVAEADLARMEAFYADRNLAPELSLCPLADESLVDALGARGYRIRMFMHTWVRELTDDGRRTTDGVVVRPIERGEADLWVRTAWHGFAGDDVAPPDDLVISPYPTMAHATCWLAWLDGERLGDEPAGAGSLAIHNGVAELFGTSTRPSCRGRGVQAALIHARMAAAAAAGCDLIAVHTDPGSASQRNVERAGFRLAYTKVTLRRAGS